MQLTTLDEQPDMYSTCVRRHVKLDIDEAGCLRGRPMDARRRSRWCDAGSIDDKIPHLTVEYIGRYPVQVLSVVGVAVYQAKALEVAGGL